jgi:hypothetical protein
MGSFISLDKSGKLSVARKGRWVTTSGPKLPGNIMVGELQPIEGCGKHHGPVRDCKTLL